MMNTEDMDFNIARKVLYFIVLATILSSCQKTGIDVVLAVDNYDVKVDGAEGYTTIMVYGVDRFEAESQAAWLTLTEFRYGDDRGSFRAIFSANTGNTAREAHILIRSGRNETSVRILQDKQTD